MYYLVVLLFTGSFAGKASEYTRKSIALDIDTAFRYIPTDRFSVYVFASSDYFDNATVTLLPGITLLRREQNYLLNNTALSVFNRNVNTYYQFVDDGRKHELTNDTIGVKVIKPSALVVL